jgi:hypothetical protein
MISSTSITKTYDKKLHVSFLNSLYQALHKKDVPNVDHLIQYSIDESSVILGPRGIASLPNSAQQVREAIICILEALVVSLSRPPSSIAYIDSH